MLAQGKIVAVTLMGIVSIGVVARTFWIQDLQYALPTPIPPSWKAIPQFAIPVLPARIASYRSLDSRCPTLLNFYNPDCPCSRFNLDHVRALLHRYGTRLRCITIIEIPDSAETKQEFGSLHLSGDCVTDTDGHIAAACGVYSTPQAVILDAAGRLIYRGNYNSGRYCTEPQSEYARLALDALLAHAPLTHFPDNAIRAYGCALPANRLQERSQ